MQHKSVEKILRHKRSTRQCIEEVSAMIGKAGTVLMKCEIDALRKEWRDSIEEAFNDPFHPHDNWYYYQRGVVYNSLVREICHRFRVNHYYLEESRVKNLERCAKVSLERVTVWVWECPVCEAENHEEDDREHVGGVVCENCGREFKLD